MQIYVVKTRDTLWQLSQQFGVSGNDIALVNEIEDPNQLVVGQSLVIPTPGRNAVVHAGDTIQSLANQYGVSIENLMRVNRLNEASILSIGQLLLIPSFIHVIQPGETLSAIANRYGVSIHSLSQINGITNTSLIYAGQSIRIPLMDRPVTEINAYTTAISDEGAQEVRRLGHNFTYLSPFMYSVKEDGSLTEMQEGALLDAAKATDTASLLVLTNFRNRKFDSDLAATILRNATIQETLITNLLAIMKEKGYQGLNIDFEYVYPEDRENYNAFLRKLAPRLHAEGFLLSTALAPKESADQPGLLYEAHDYQAQGEIVDFIILMTYEWGWAGGPPLAIAPINKVRDVLDFAVSVIPRNKIMMGIPLYGRDWKIPWEQGTIARTISPQAAVRLAKEHGAAIQYHEQYQSPFFRYTDDTGQQHEVWFEDARSMQVKYDTIKQYGIRGGSYWVLGNPFPQNWPVLQQNFFIKK
ncbi:LysM peptidoglycan-binding domain-containing protein [Ornithinibacillus gellani]|uniref:LysM peptidoglycan-binding domain-containing protein n=1 Tax=Ornithinibacillus gellani TaxID=2293253 RepID=UPI000F492995|nr:LysM peptidoglycan-binding domain-containing protein [Ornithinibacillus gellani]TQS71030.1 LysM peptidoglycan-binding domain-containing protein [Ornithinibacillus gellani]